MQFVGAAEEQAVGALIVPIMAGVAVGIDEIGLVKITRPDVQRLVDVLDVMGQQAKGHARADVGEKRLGLRFALQNQDAGRNGVDDIDVGRADGIVAVFGFLERDVGVMEDEVIGVGRFELQHFLRLVVAAFD